MHDTSLYDFKQSIMYSNLKLNKTVHSKTDLNLSWSYLKHALHGFLMNAMCRVLGDELLFRLQQDFPDHVNHENAFSSNFHDAVLPEGRTLWTNKHRHRPRTNCTSL